MGSFIIKGNQKLSGIIVPQGAKNEALQVICSTLLTDQRVVVHNIPDIVDVNNLMLLLEKIGVKIEALKQKHSFSFQANQIDTDYLESKEFIKYSSSLRGSVMIVGPLLARFGKGCISKPGGDKIGRRRLDTHFRGLKALGATFNYDKENHFFSVEAARLYGAYILLDEASVTGTGNILMAAVLAEGTTTIYNAACEPYLQQLCRLLNQMGAKITGIGSNLLTVEGVSQLSGSTHTILPDMIEVGSWIGLAALTQSNIIIKNVGWDYLGVIPSTFQKLGVKLNRKENDIHIPAHNDGYEIQNYIDDSILTVSDAPWPGFTPDLLSIIIVVATQARGSVLIHQKMFESRLFFVDKLIDMGAKIILCDPHRATVIGNDFKSNLKSTIMTSPDIRAGISLLIAALSAKGTSTIHNIEQIDRGYQNIVERLQHLGAHIERKN